MIIWIYGQQKSASSYCFQLVCDVLESAGYEQTERRKAILGGVDAAMASGLRTTKWTSVGAMLGALGQDEDPVAIKTHGNLTEKLRQMLEDGRAQAFATFRDPRDAALSLFEHGARLRAQGDNTGFAEKRTLAQALDYMAEMLPRVQEWSSHPLVTSISYDTLRERPIEAVQRIARRLGIPMTRDNAEKIIAPYATGSKTVSNMNIGRAGRFYEVASAEEKAAADQLFSSYVLPSEQDVRRTLQAS